MQDKAITGYRLVQIWILRELCNEYFEAVNGSRGVRIVYLLGL